MIVNLTTHIATKEQFDAGVKDLPSDFLEALAFYYKVDNNFSKRDINYNVTQILAILNVIQDLSEELITGVLIGDVPFMMRDTLIELLKQEEYRVMESEYKSQEVVMEEANGSLATFNSLIHVGFKEL